MKSAARLALILVCISMALSFGQYLMAWTGAYNMFVYRILGPLVILLNGLPVVILSLALMRSSEE